MKHALTGINPLLQIAAGTASMSSPAFAHKMLDLLSARIKASLEAVGAEHFQTSGSISSEWHNIALSEEAAVTSFLFRYESSPPSVAYALPAKPIEDPPDSITLRLTDMTMDVGTLLFVNQLRPGYTFDLHLFERNTDLAATDRVGVGFRYQGLSPFHRNLGAWSLRTGDGFRDNSSIRAALLEDLKKGNYSLARTAEIRGVTPEILKATLDNHGLSLLVTMSLRDFTAHQTSTWLATALNMTGGEKQRAADLLGVHWNTFFGMLSRSHPDRYLPNPRLEHAIRSGGIKLQKVLQETAGQYLYGVIRRNDGDLGLTLRDLGINASRLTTLFKRCGLPVERASSKTMLTLPPLSASHGVQLSLSEYMKAFDIAWHTTAFRMSSGNSGVAGRRLQVLTDTFIKRRDRLNWGSSSDPVIENIIDESGAVDFESTRKRAEREYICEAIRLSDGNIEVAAKRLKISVEHLASRLVKLGLPPEWFSDAPAKHELNLLPATRGMRWSLQPPSMRDIQAIVDYAARIISIGDTSHVDDAIWAFSRQLVSIVSSSNVRELLQKSGAIHGKLLRCVMPSGETGLSFVFRIGEIRINARAPMLYAIAPSPVGHSEGRLLIKEKNGLLQAVETVLFIDTAGNNDSLYVNMYSRSESSVPQGSEYVPFEYYARSKFHKNLGTWPHSTESTAGQYIKDHAAYLAFEAAIKSGRYSHRQIARYAGVKLSSVKRLLDKFGLQHLATVPLKQHDDHANALWLFTALNMTGGSPTGAAKLLGIATGSADRMRQRLRSFYAGPDSFLSERLAEGRVELLKELRKESNAYILEVLNRLGGDVVETARVLEISEDSVYRVIRGLR